MAWSLAEGALVIIGLGWIVKDGKIKWYPHTNYSLSIYNCSVGIDTKMSTSWQLKLLAILEQSSENGTSAPINGSINTFINVWAERSTLI